MDIISDIEKQLEEIKNSSNENTYICIPIEQLGELLDILNKKIQKEKEIMEIIGDMNLYDINAMKDNQSGINKVYNMLDEEE